MNDWKMRNLDKLQAFGATRKATFVSFIYRYFKEGHHLIRGILKERLWNTFDIQWGSLIMKCPDDKDYLKR